MDALTEPSTKMPFTLPIFLTSKNKYLCSAIGGLLGAFLYLSSNHFLLVPPHLLPMTSIDRAIPFIPETVWIYNSDGFLFFAAYIVSKDLMNLNKYLYSFFVILTLSVTIFFLWPTTYPRDLYPLPLGVDAWTKTTVEHLRGVDAPTNCLPSLHVSMSYLSAFIFLDEQKKKFAFFFTWATVVAVSTLTTKQHYLADVITGLALALIVYFIFHRLMKYKLKTI